MGERFYFGLAGSYSLEDPSGLPFESELAAFRSAEKLAEQISAARPALCGKVSVVVSRQNSVEEFFVSVGNSRCTVLEAAQIPSGNVTSSGRNASTPAKELK